MPSWSLPVQLLVHILVLVLVANHLCADGVLRHRQRGSGEDEGTSTEGPAALPAPGRAPGPASPEALIGRTVATSHAALSRPAAPDVTEYVIHEQQKAQLPCDVPQNLLNLVQIFWLHDGEAVDVHIVSAEGGGHHKAGHRYTRDVATGSLTVSDARLEDDGVWVCQAKEAISKSELYIGPHVRLVVLVPPRQPYLLLDGRRLDPTNLFIFIKENNELAVDCVVEGGNPAPSITWLLSRADRRGGVELSDDSAAGELVSTGPANRSAGHHLTSSARIGRVGRAHHNATVSCLVSHQTLAGPLNASLLLDVQYAPLFDLSRTPGFGIPVREGIALSLKCDVDSNPPCSPVWQKDDKMPPVPQSEDGFLNFTSVKREDSGWYKCTCRHHLVESASNAYLLQIRLDDVTTDPYLGMGDAPPSDAKYLEATLGGSVELKCPWGSCWSRVSPSGTLEPALGSGNGSSGNPSILSIDRVLYQEAGEYRCGRPSQRSEHELRQWRNTYSVYMNVSGRPMVHPAVQSVAVLSGRSVSVSVEFCANPPATRVMWVTQQLLLTPGRADPVRGHQARPVSASNTSHCHHAVLTLHSVTPEDEGEYLFLVRSPGGATEGSVIVNVTRASGYSAASPSLGPGADHSLSALAALCISSVLAVFNALSLSSG